MFEGAAGQHEAKLSPRSVPARFQVIWMISLDVGWVNSSSVTFNHPPNQPPNHPPKVVAPLERVGHVRKPAFVYVWGGEV
jgi:hypothetical protein